MDAYIIGKLIKEFRIRKGYSQEELCYGICAVSTLSRIESGNQVPNKKTAESLLSRLGETLSENSMIMSKIEIERMNIESKIKSKILKADYEIADLLGDYLDLGEMSPLEQQTYMLFMSIYKKRHQTELLEVMENFSEALKITMPDFQIGEKIRHNLLTTTELILINNIALIAYSMKEERNAIALMEFLKTYFEKNSVSEQEKSQNYPVILFNLSNWKGLAGFYKEAQTLAETGIKVCSLYGRLAYYPLFIFNKGWCLYKLGETKDGIWHMKNSLTNLNYQERFVELDDLVSQLKEDLGIEFKEEDYRR